MWEHLTRDEAARRTAVLETTGAWGLQRLSALSFTSGDRERSRELWVQCMGREPDPLEDVVSDADVLMSALSDFAENAPGTWNALHRVANNLAAPAEFFETVAQRFRPVLDEFPTSIAANPSIPSRVLLTMKVPDLRPYTDEEDDWWSETNEFLNGTARNFGVTSEVLSHWGVFPEASARVWEASRVAENIALPVEVMDRWAHHPDSEIRRSLADNQMLPPDIAATMSQDPEPNVRLSLLTNMVTSTLPDIAVTLAADADPQVRAAAGVTPLPADVLAALAIDPNDLVRNRVAANPATPPDVLLSLTTRGDSELMGAARNPAAPADLLSELSEHADRFVRCGVAGNPNAPEEVLVVLAADSDTWIRDAACTNPSATDAVRAAGSLSGWAPTTPRRPEWSW